MRLAVLPQNRWGSRAVIAGLVLAGLVGTVVPANAATAGSAPAAASAAPGAIVPSNDATRLVAAMQPGWGLGNSLDAIPDETAWGNPPISQDLLLKVKSLGYKSIRIPVTWGIHEGAAPDYTVDPAFMARTKQVVDWALADGFHVVLNVHHDSWQWITNMPTDPTGVTAHYNATWTQIADEFKDEPGKLILEADNEQSFPGITEAQGETLLNQLQTSFYNIVRSSGSKNASRYLMLSTLGDSATPTSEDALYAEMQSLHDSHLIASFHYYGYWPFGVNVAGVNTFDATSQKDMVTDFTLMHDDFIAKGIPVYAGEVGLYNDYTGNQSIERGEGLKYYEALGYEARLTGVTLNYWDDGGRILNRNTLQLLDPATFAMSKSSWTTRSGTASNDTVYVPKASPIADASLTLNPNGLQFTGLSNGDKRLEEGCDYTVSGDTLTLKAALLTKLVGPQAYGVNATLQAHFSRGLPWQINIVTNAQPVLSAATGTTSSFTIPTQFNGDTLSMMQSVYADGSNAGQAGWTPYQAYGTSFSADYPNSAIILPADYLNSLTDGQRVTLTFHFWSGATATYYVTKTGTTVTGTPS
ncbi:cellulase family glycosylhydrolase [Catenulispora pinisilvae]|uniref:cellulase family glycosylhydrolase n=1 Tax=Catenulispora pinisilvae TaxID=2705253 RepID=UPI0018911CDB|nr:cellulase family glycosylhydrolase [Catenulispora pinisilvae]